MGMKIGEHSGGEVVENPTHLNREVDSENRSRIESFLDSHFQFSRKRLVHESVCMYSMSEDEHFVIDRHPDVNNVVFAAGMSGHGFKFTNVIGEHLVNLLKGESDPLFEFLKAGVRFGGETKSNS